MKAKKFVVVTIGYGSVDELIYTIRSIDEQILIDGIDISHIVVASGISRANQDYICGCHGRDNRLFIFDKDTSLYNAMNLGVAAADGDFVLFLNGGDRLLNDRVLFMLSHVLVSKTCYVFRSLQVWKGLAFVRPGIKTHVDLIKPAHQAFIAPLSSVEKIYYDESRLIDADVVWIGENIKRFGVKYSDDIISVFNLGGISNYPCFKAIRLRASSQGVKAAFFEAIKLLARIMVGIDSYYKIMSYRAGYDRLS